ncbi:AAA family ATPase [Mesorhizobium helmanticense]|uniref:AAA family ATPase n=2 Tax=Mesorhizobium helmanticense TaxID=1776423 RepID=A0A2T4J1U3_9HYPH|nr:AAA family ATPase [Mesorhizobium helmanticense]
MGKVKILHRPAKSNHKTLDKLTALPNEFSSLDSGYISLGQSQDYYESLSAIFTTDGAIEVLEALRDIAEMPALSSDFDTDTAFRNGLERENSAKRARRFARAWVRQQDSQPDPAFTYSLNIGQGSVPTICDFAFDEKSKLPGRIVAIIGRNAVGKTMLLSHLAADLTQVDRISVERQAKVEGRFSPGRPLFVRVIAISYSAFDKFRRPEVTPYSSYVYCGIRDEKGSISQRALSQSYDTNRTRIRELGRAEDWIFRILAVLGEDQGLSESSLRLEIMREAPGTLIDDLSSGQAILCHFVTALLAWIQTDTLVLFDEPETHLHPNALASLFLALTSILRQHRSFAVVATHSPVVLQEIPSRRVLHFVRTEATTVAELLTTESFGESVTELTRHVFKTMEVESLYKEVLSRLSNSMTVEEVLDLFPRGLGLAAQAYLFGKYADRAEK